MYLFYQIDQPKPQAVRPFVCVKVFEKAMEATGSCRCHARRRCHRWAVSKLISSESTIKRYQMAQRQFYPQLDGCPSLPLPVRRPLPVKRYFFLPTITKWRLPDCGASIFRVFSLPNKISWHYCCCKPAVNKTKTEMYICSTMLFNFLVCSVQFNADVRMCWDVDWPQAVRPQFSVGPQPLQVLHISE